MVKFLKKEEKESTNDIIEDKPDAELLKVDVKANKREFEDEHHDEHEGDHHHGEHEDHEGEHGHHKHDDHEHDHHHHDHGYEFYEEWGEHGGHEGEHHGEDEGEHHGDHDHNHHHNHRNSHGGQRDIVPSNIEQFGSSLAMFKQPHTREVGKKKWWMVGDHWEGWGHDAWDKPHIHHDEGGWQYENNGLKESHHKRHIKKKTRKATKRCEDTGHQHVECNRCGYHFHDCGCDHHDEDHDLEGCWKFGYDNFGDDWDDWDHNHHNFEHLKDLEHEEHGKREDHECHDKRSCVQIIPVYALPFPSLPINLPSSANPRPFVYPTGSVPQYGYGVIPFTHSHNSQGIYQLCRDCSWLPRGGTRCLCKNINTYPTIYNHLPDQVFLDCDSSIHRYPQPNCIARHAVPTPTLETSSGAEAKQGIVYPYVGYGPWSAYPWWGDWWGGHGNHGWGKNVGLGENHETTDINHHGHESGGRHFPEGYHLGAYHCRDVVLKGKVEDNMVSKRFCLPIGYQNYNYPYWHGYPGVGTGLWGWGWPWIKNKIPGSQKNKPRKVNKSKTKKSTKYSDQKERKSVIPATPIEQTKNTKKQTIHVGYGYASGDNYRLGYGIGGMGGVAGFSSNPALSQNGFTRSKIPGDQAKDNSNAKTTKTNIPASEAHENSNVKTAKANIPTPEASKEITASKRNLENVSLKSQPSYEVKNTIPKPSEKDPL